MITGQSIVKDTGLTNDNKRIFVFTGLLSLTEGETVLGDSKEYRLVGSSENRNNEGVFLTILPYQEKGDLNK